MVISLKMIGAKFSFHGKPIKAMKPIIYSALEFINYLLSHEEFCSYKDNPSVYDFNNDYMHLKV